MASRARISSVLFVSMVSQGAMAFQPDLHFNMSFSDMHAFYAWYPQLQSSTKETSWSTTFSESPTYVPGMVGVGESSHNLVTNDTGSLSLQFYGNGIWIEGALDTQWPPSTSTTGALAPFELSVDNGGVNRVRIGAKPTSPIVASLTNLPMGFHKASFSTAGLKQPFYNMTITGLTLQLAIQCPKATSLADVPTIVQPFVVNGKMSDFFRYRGNWNVSHTIGGANGQAPVQYEHASGSAAPTMGYDVGTSSLAFAAVPTNSSLLIINGTMGPDHGEVRITTSPPPLSFQDVLDYERKRLYNPWVARDVVIYLATLDPSIEYNVTVEAQQLFVESTNTTLNGIGLHSVTFYSGISNVTDDAPPTANTSDSASGPGGQSGQSATGMRLTSGQIAGIVVGAVVGIALIAAAAYFIAVRRISRRRMAPADPSTFVVDDDAPPATPYSALSPLSEKDSVARAPLIPRDTKVDPALAMEAGPSSSNGSSSAPVSPVSPQVQRQPNPVEVVRVEQAQDGGAVERVEWIPPQYNPEWEYSAAPNASALHIPGAEQAPQGYTPAQQVSRDQLLSPHSPLAFTHPYPTAADPIAPPTPANVKQEAQAIVSDKKQ